MARMPAVSYEQAMKILVLRVRFSDVKRRRARMWVARQLIGLACRVVGCGVVFEE